MPTDFLKIEEVNKRKMRRMQGFERTEILTPVLLALGIGLMAAGAVMIFLTQDWRFLLAVGAGIVVIMLGVVRSFSGVNLFNSVIQVIALALIFIGVVLAVLFGAWYWTFIAILAAIVLLFFAFFRSIQ